MFAFLIDGNPKPGLPEYEKVSTEEEEDEFDEHRVRFDVHHQLLGIRVNAGPEEQQRAAEPWLQRQLKWNFSEHRGPAWRQSKGRGPNTTDSTSSAFLLASRGPCGNDHCPMRDGREHQGSTDTPGGRRG